MVETSFSEQRALPRVARNHLQNTLYTDQRYSEEGVTVVFANPESDEAFTTIE